MVALVPFQVLIVEAAVDNGNMMELVDFDDLMMALETAEGMMEWYLDKETGDIFMLADESERDDMDSEYVEKMEEDPDRFVYIEPIPSYESYQVMESFIDSLPEGEAKNMLNKAISMRKPFRNFKDTLCDYPEIREKWFKFQEDIMFKKANDWLEDENIDAELIKNR